MPPNAAIDAVPPISSDDGELAVQNIDSAALFYFIQLDNDVDRKCGLVSSMCARSQPSTSGVCLGTVRDRRRKL